MSTYQLPTLRGGRVLLRQPVAADLLARMEIPRDAEEGLMYGGPGVSKAFSHQEAAAIFEPYRQQDVQHERRFVIAALVWPDGRAVGDGDGRCIGTIRLHHIEAGDRRARLAIGIFDRRFWSHGYGSEAIQLLLTHAFDTLNLHRVDLRVLAYNTRAIRAYEKCGFVREGVERESALVNGAWHDDVMMSILDHEFALSPKSSALCHDGIYPRCRPDLAWQPVVADCCQPRCRLRARLTRASAVCWPPLGAVSDTMNLYMRFLDSVDNDVRSTRNNQLARADDSTITSIERILLQMLDRCPNAGDDGCGSTRAVLCDVLSKVT